MENSDTSVKNNRKITKFCVATNSHSKFVEKNSLYCNILNVNEFCEADELTSNKFYVQSLPFRVKIKRAKKNVSKKPVRGSTLNIRLVVGEKGIGRWSSKFSVRFRAKVNSDELFDQTYNHELKPSQNDISHSIDWENLANLSDFKFEILVSADFPGSGYVWPSRESTGFYGIRNEGATCYVNSLLQSLFCTNAFRRIVYEIPIEPEEANDSFVSLKYIFFAQQFGETDNVRTVKLISSFGWDEMNATTQQDIQEFLRRLMEKLEQSLEGSKFAERLLGLFVGELKKTITCKNVIQQSTRCETFWDVQLSFDDETDIFEAFRTYLKPSSISDYNCGQGTDEAEQVLEFVKLPPVLHVQLQRFKYDPKANAVVKKFFATLDLTPFCDDATYTLHSVLVHSGKATTGHYVAYICPKANGKWYQFNDTTVTECSIEDAIDYNHESDRRSTNAYMLIYIKDSYISDILCDINQNEVASVDLIKAEIQKEVREFEDKENTLQVNVFKPENMKMAKEYKTDENLFDPKFSITFMITKDKTMNDFLDALGEAMTLTDPRKTIKLWQLSPQHDRIKELDFEIDQVMSEQFKKDSVPFFVDVLSEEDKLAFDKTKQALILIRQYDPSVEEGKLIFFSHRYFDMDQTLRNVQEYIHAEIGHQGDVDDIAICNDSGNPEIYDVEYSISKISIKSCGTYSARIVFELLDGNHEPKYISLFDSKILDVYSKQSTPSSANTIEITVKHDGAEFFQHAFEEDKSLYQIAQKIADMKECQVDCIQLFDVTDKCIDREFFAMTLKDFNEQRKIISQRCTRSHTARMNDDLIFSFTILEPLDHEFEPIVRDPLNLSLTPSPIPSSMRYDDGPMDYDDGPHNTSGICTPPKSPCSPILIPKQMTAIDVKFENLENSSEHCTSEYSLDIMMMDILQTFSSQYGKDGERLRFFDSSRQPLDDSSRYAPLKNLICADEDSLTLYFQYVDENIQRASSTSPPNHERGAFMIDVFFQHRNHPENKIIFTFNRRKSIEEAFTELASHINRGIFDLVFHVHDKLVDPSDKPLELISDIDSNYLVVHFELGEKPSKRKRLHNSSDNELNQRMTEDDVRTLNFIDHHGENSVIDIQLKGVDKLSTAVEQIIFAMNLDKEKVQFFNSAGDRITYRLNGTVGDFLMHNDNNITYKQRRVNGS